MSQTTTKQPTGRGNGGDGTPGQRYHLRLPPELTPEIAARRWRELNRLLHSLVVLHGEVRDRKPYEPILRAAGGIVAAPRGLLYLREEPLGGVRLVVASGFRGRIPERMRSANALAAAAMQVRKPILVNDPPEEPLREELRLLGESSCVTVPILRRGLPWGAVQLLRSTPFLEEEAVLLWIYALILEEALAVATEVTRLPESPPVTDLAPGLVDRAQFDTKLDWEIERAAWVGRPCSILRVGWRPPEGEVNGDYDLRLGRALRAIRRSLRPIDQVSIWRERNLLISLPDVDSMEAHRVAQDIRRNLVQSRALGEEEGVLPGLRLAFATYPIHGRTREDLTRALDRLFEGEENPPEMSEVRAPEA